MNEPAWAQRGDDDAVAAYIAEAIKGGARSLAFPGGSTPAAILPLLASQPLRWSEVTIIPGDDRIVPADHPASNYGNLVRLIGDTGARVRPLVQGPFDHQLHLAWIGMGGDGHFASIFPNMAIGTGDPPAVVRARPDPLPPEAPFDRLTLNYQALSKADRIMLVLRGVPKRELLEAAMAGANDLPIARLLRIAGDKVTIFWSEQ